MARRDAEWSERVCWSIDVVDRRERPVGLEVLRDPPTKGPGPAVDALARDLKCTPVKRCVTRGVAGREVGLHEVHVRVEAPVRFGLRPVGRERLATERVSWLPEVRVDDREGLLEDVEPLLNLCGGQARGGEHNERMVIQALWEIGKTVAETREPAAVLSVAEIGRERADPVRQVLAPPLVALG